MTKISLNELTTLRWSFEEDVVEAARRGMEAIGVWRPKLAEFGTEKAAELLAEYRMEASSLSWAGGFTGCEYRTFRESVHDGIEAVQTAAALGSPNLIVISGSRNSHIQNHAARMVKSALTEISQAAQSYGVNLLLEPIHPGTTGNGSLVSDIRMALEILAEVDEDNVGLVVDTYHLGIDGTILNWFADVMPYVRLIQLGDGRAVPMGEPNRCLLGDGTIPITEIVRQAIENGYEGIFEIELCGEDIEHLEYGCVLDASQAFINDAVADCCRSLDQWTE